MFSRQENACHYFIALDYSHYTTRIQSNLYYAV